MKKLIILLSILLLPSLSFAIEREFTSDTGNTGNHTAKSVNQASQTNFERIGVSGSQTTGNTGYAAFMACDNLSRCYPYYLWVDGSTGNVCVASYPTVSTYSSFPTGDWRSTTGMNCPKVGSQ